MLSLFLLLACSGTTPEPAPQPEPKLVEPEPDPFVQRAPIAPAFERSAELDTALAKQDWARIAFLTENPDSGAQAFVHAWARLQLGQASAVVDLVEQVQGPDPYVGYLKGRLLEADGRPEDALKVLVPNEDNEPLHREILAWRATCLEQLGRVEQAKDEYERLIAAPDPADGSAHALAELGGSENQWRIWSHYPGSAQDKSLPPMGNPTWQQATHRAQAYMNKGMYKTAIKTLDGHAPDTNIGEEACLFRYVKGRSLYKGNKRTDAVAAFGTGATDCVGTQVGHKLAYLHGRTEQKRGNNRSAARVLETLAKNYPDHSYADDGLVMAGESLDLAGDTVGAQRLWAKAAQDHPEGDMIPEALWRLAWSHYEQGNGDKAREVALQLAALSPAQDHFHVPAGRYWAARWALYPDVTQPTQARTEDEAHPDPQGTAVGEWSQLVQDLPWSYYATLASSRVAEEDPAAFAAIPAPPAPAVSETWTLERTQSQAPGLARAEALLALGLHGLAREEIAEVPLDGQGPLWWSASRSANGDWINAHRELRVWMRTHVPSQATPETAREMALAFPDHWLPQVKVAADGYRFDPRYFQGLVRVESNFDETAVSWAGARGLCQVMPTTGKNVGAWLGLKVGKPELLDPEINLAVGARYMDYLHKLFNDSPYLSAAGYNAGENRILQWVREKGNMPTDEFVERIPFEETRGYVKRVVGTWQTYGWVRDGSGVRDLSKYNQQALVE